MNGEGTDSGGALRRSPEIPPAAAPLSPTAMILLCATTVAGLYLGRDVLIPLALAILLSFALGPLVTWLYRRGLPRVPAVLTVMLLVTLIIAGFAALVASQLTHLGQNLPTYEANLRIKGREVAAAAPSGGMINRTADLLREFNREIDKITQGPAGDTPDAAAPTDEPPKPIPVEIHEPPPPPLEALSTFFGPLLQPIATAGIVLVFIVFVLLQREDLRDRMIRLFGMGDVHRATAAISDAAKRIGRYLLMQLVVNLLYGLPIGVGLFLIGVPNALLWGILATVLRFIPYLGPILAAILPIALSFAIDTGWTTPLLTMALFLAVELFVSNVLEPWLYGSSTGLSPLAIIVAAVFWTTLWGPVGLLLATPLTVCLVVLGRHVPQLQFFEVLLGDQPVLAPEVKFYQRLLAGDPHEAEELAEDLLEEQPLAELMDQVVLPALLFADQDRQRGVLEPARAQAVADLVMTIVDDLVEPLEPQPAPTPAGIEGRVLCLGARYGLDTAAATILAQLLRRRGLTVDIADAGALLRGGTPPERYDAVCLSYLDPGAVRQARRLLLRVRARLGRGTPACVCLWGCSTEQAAKALSITGAGAVAGSIAEAADALLDLLRPPAEPAEDRPTPAPALDRTG